MNIQANKLKSLVGIGCFAILLTAASVLFMSGCTNTIDGEVTANQPPIVYFVNIPPDGFKFSRNPEVYWWGTDKDGLIDYYRYYVNTTEAAGADPLAYAAGLHDTMWTYVDVDSTASDPQTANIIPLSANLDDPVNTYIEQYIFLQAYDNLGASSDIVFRRLFRNDNPPDTKIYNVDSPYVNAVLPGGLVTGMTFQWEGSDVKDYEEAGLTAPPFEYEWTLYGPYTNAELASLITQYTKQVFVTEDAHIYYVGDTLFLCDTTLTDTGVIEVCDTFPFTSATLPTALWSVDTLLLVESEDFIASDFNRVNRQSSNGVDGWVSDVSTTIYDVFNDYPSDTTIKMQFIFWVKSRDDAGVQDLVPAFKAASCIDPKFERDVIVLDFNTNVPVPSRIIASPQPISKRLWSNFLKGWKSDIVFDTVNIVGLSGIAKDFINTRNITTIVPVNFLLSHKVMILYNDHLVRSDLVSNGVTNAKFVPIFQAMDVGINTWVTMRAPVGGSTSLFYTSEIAPSPEFRTYFGVDNAVYSGWFATAAWTSVPRGPRIEDFIGAYSIDESSWPNLELDTALLHSRYMWLYGSIGNTWIDTIACLPEVDWYKRSYGTEVMYLYKSRFGNENPYLVDQMEGSPVAHRLETNLYRTFYTAFTPFSIDSAQMQTLANTMLDWLYDEQKWVGSDAVDATLSTTERYPDAAVQISPQEIVLRREALLQSVRDQQLTVDK